MPRKPKAKNTLSAGERVALYEAELAKKAGNKALGGAESPEMEKEKVISEAAEGVKTTLEAEQKKPARRKPSSATVRVDFSITTGEIKPMHGMCNGPVSYGADITDKFKEIGVPTVRFDGASGYGGFALDVSGIFENFDKDPADPESYDFSAADKIVEAALVSGAKVMLRLGESHDLFCAGGDMQADVDADVMSRVCVNILRHFNGGFARGAHYGIEYFEIDVCLADATGYELYGRLANSVKLYDESLKVGGGCFEDASKVREFLRACKKRRYPVDFVALECFCGDVAESVDLLSGACSFVKNLGFDSLEVIAARWMLADRDVIGDKTVRKALSSGRAADIRRELVVSQRSVKGAAYCAAMMLAMNAVEGVSGACFFDAQPISSPFCSLTDDLGNAQKPFYSFRAFGELYRARDGVLCSVDRQEGFAHSGIYAAAALSSGGEGVIAIASFDGVEVIDVRIDGIRENHFSADVYMLDGVKNMELVDSVPISGMKKRLVLNVSKYGAVLIKLH